MHKKFKEFLKNPKMFKEYNEVAEKYLDSMRLSVNAYEYMTEFYEFLKNYELKTEDIVYIKYQGDKDVYVTFDIFVELVANNLFDKHEQILFKDNTLMYRDEYDLEYYWRLWKLPKDVEIISDAEKAKEILKKKGVNHVNDQTV